MSAAVETRAPQPVTIAQAITIARAQKASDLHITADDVIRTRVGRRLGALPYIVERERITEYVATLRARNRAVDTEMARLGAFNMREVDEQGGAFRLHVYQDANGFRLALRLLGEKPPEFSILRLPATIGALTDKSSGFIYISAPQGMGKTFLLHGMVDLINKRGGRSINLIEHPKEFVHVAAPGTVLAQLEPGRGLHTPSYEHAVVAAMNGDIDVIVIGQITSYGEAKATLTAAGRGALVIGTGHGSNTVKGIESMLGWFPSEETQQARIQLGQCLIAVVSLRLLEHTRGGLQPVAEVLVKDEVVEGMITRGETNDIRAHMAQHADKGNKTFEQAMNELIGAGHIRSAEARKEAMFPEEIFG